MFGTADVADGIDNVSADNTFTCNPGTLSFGRACWRSGTRRTCSFCGGIHPDDAIALLKSGCVLQATDNACKYFINASDDTSLIPPVKLYGNHASPDHAKQINEILATRRTRLE
jgi:hypothetical protein